MTTRRRCTVCRLPMDPVLPWPEHPACFEPIKRDLAASDRRAREALRRALAAKTRALAVVEDAHPDALKAAVRIIRDTAARLPQLSANTVREQMDAASIPGPVRGAAFRQAITDRLIRKQGYTPSLQEATHSHPIAEYESLVYREAS